MDEFMMVDIIGFIFVDFVGWIKLLIDDMLNVKRWYEVVFVCFSVVVQVNFILSY